MDLKSHLPAGVLIVKSPETHCCQHPSLQLISLPALPLNPLIHRAGGVNNTNPKRHWSFSSWVGKTFSSLTPRIEEGMLETASPQKSLNFSTSSLVFFLLHLGTFCLIHRSLCYTCPRAVVSGWEPLFLPCWSTVVTFRLTGRMTGRSCLGLTPDRHSARQRQGTHCHQSQLRSGHAAAHRRPAPSTGWAAAPNLLIPELHLQGDPMAPHDDMHLLYTHYRECDNMCCSHSKCCEGTYVPIELTLNTS